MEIYGDKIMKNDITDITYSRIRLYNIIPIRNNFVNDFVVILIFYNEVVNNM